MFVLFESLCREYRKFSLGEQCVCIPFPSPKNIHDNIHALFILLAQNISDAKQENVLLINTGDIVSSNEILMRHLCPENETKGTYKYSKKSCLSHIAKYQSKQFPVTV